MKYFTCQSCDLMLVFENRSCERCGHTLGYLPHENQLCALQPAGGNQWHTLADPQARYKFCSNAAYDACNWLLPADSVEEFCIACRHNRTIPDLTDAENLTNWKKLEFAKHRLFYTLLRLDLPLASRADDPTYGLAFDFLAEPPAGDKKILTGHEDGVITLALREASDAEREARRTAMHEPYRTLLGHFRHEIGHYYWDKLVADQHREETCRAVFGDEREDYSDALKRHYDQGAPAGWQQHFISNYATSHPWEDFAETWSHYLHIVDCLETAQTYKLIAEPHIDHITPAIMIAPYGEQHVQTLVDAWLPLTYALNAMNRSMGLQDIYPFVITPSVVQKLAFIHGLVHAQRGQSQQPAPLAQSA